MKSTFRKIVRWMHLWLGLAGGTFICLMSFTGGLVTLRPQIANVLSPSAPNTAKCESPTDWNRAARAVTAYAGTKIDRIYGPEGSDTRYQFRMPTGNPNLFKHVIYDSCSGRVLGSIPMAWMDWTIDLHHNLLAGKTGRRWTGAIGILLLISGVSGFALWLLARPSLATAFRIRFRFSRATPREIHRSFGLAVTCLLMLEASTGVWLAFPETMKGMLSPFVQVEESVKPASARGAKQQKTQASLAEFLAASGRALPDGVVREVRMPEGNSNAQVRMWRPGDFRSSGNNVVYLAASGAQILAVNCYEDRTRGNRFVQAMSALHYDEWGGLPLRIVFAVAGLTTPLLFVTGILMWLYSRKLKAPVPSRQDKLVREAVAVG